MSNVRFAINPLQWIATPDGWIDPSLAPPYPQLLEEVKEAGFDASTVQMDLADAFEEYRDAFETAGVTPAPGYFGGPMHDPAERAGLVERARRLAHAHAALGLTEVFVAAGMRLDAPRIAHPARGYDPDEARLEELALSFEQVGEATKAEGVTSCLHQHVGTWIEVEDEVEWLLSRINPEVLALGPDNGHLAWAGVDPVALVRRHSGRVKALHLKDARVSVADRFRDRNDVAYNEVVREGLWVEPGRGELDLRAMLEALPADFDGWAIIEVDMPDLPTVKESARACAEWVQELSERPGDANTDLAHATD